MTPLTTSKALLALAACATLRAETPEKVALPRDWPVGTRYHLEHTHVREEFAEAAEARAAPASTTITGIDVEVVARRADGYTLRWTFDRRRAEAPAGMPAVLSDGMSGLVRGLRMDLETDASGSITRLANLAEMEEHFSRASQRLVSDLRSGRTVPEDQIVHLGDTLSGLRGQALESAFVAPARTFHLASGAVLTPEEKTTWEDRLPNPFGGDALPAIASIELSALDSAAQRARVDWRRTIDPAKAGPVLEASIRAQARRSGRELPAEAALAFEAIEDAATWTYDLKTGIPVTFVTTRTTRSMGVRHVETDSVTVSDVRIGGGTPRADGKTPPPEPPAPK